MNKYYKKSKLERKQQVDIFLTKKNMSTTVADMISNQEALVDEAKELSKVNEYDFQTKSLNVEKIKGLIKEIPVWEWEKCFGEKLIVHNDFAPNNLVQLVFSDGEVIATKGSWSFLQRSLFTKVGGNFLYKCKDEPFNNWWGEDFHGTNFSYLLTYNTIIAESMGKALNELIEEKHVEVVRKKM